MKTLRTSISAVAFLVLSVAASAKTITITQPQGGSFTKGQPMTITWTKDFAVTGAHDDILLIKLCHRTGDIGSEFDVVGEVLVNAGQFLWPDVGHTKNKDVPADSNYFLVLFIKTDSATSASSAPFAIKNRLMAVPSQQFLKPAFPAEYLLRNIKIYSPWEGVIFKFNEACPVMWDRTHIASYDKVFFYVRWPDGTNAAVNQMFATAPSPGSNPQASGLFCGSGNCGLYAITLAPDALLPSPTGQYYLDLFTGDHKYTGKSQLFYWQ